MQYVAADSSSQGSAPRYLQSLPSHWQVKTLAQCVDILDGRRVPVNSDDREKRVSGRAPDELFPYFGATGRVGCIDGYLFDEELVLLGEDGAPFLEFAKNKAYLIKGKSWVNNHAHVLRARTGIASNPYICHFLNSFDYHGYVTGTTRLKLNQAAMRQIPIVLPPVAQQRLIVAAIDQQFSRLEVAIKDLTRAQANLRRYRAAVLKAACEGRLVPQDPNDEPASELLRRILAERRARWEADQLGKMRVKGQQPKDGKWRERYEEPVGPNTGAWQELPNGWCWASLPQLGELNRGKSKHRPRNDPRLLGGPYPFIQTGDVKRSGGFIRSHEQTYSELGLAQSRLWPAGTLCITIAANIAETGFLTYPACFPDSVVGFSCDGQETTTRFVELFLRTMREELERFAPATAQRNINLDVLSGVSVPVPPSAEQARIVSEVDRQLSVIHGLESTVTGEIRRAARLRQSILKRAFEGKLIALKVDNESEDSVVGVGNGSGKTSDQGVHHLRQPLLPGFGLPSTTR